MSSTTTTSRLPNRTAAARKALAFACFLMLPFLAAASPDHSDDYLVVEGKGYYIRANPLDKFLTLSCKRKWLKDYVDNFIEPYWPEYTRYWEVKDDKLYLVKIETNGPEKKQYPLEKLFVHYDGKPVFAKWFTGIVSYRYKNSPILHLNHDYYEKESVIRFKKGVAVGRFIMNHRQRWLSYARRLMEKDRPLADLDLDDIDKEIEEAGGMKEFLDAAFAVVTHPEKKVSNKYYPTIRINLNADLENFEIKPAYTNLTSYGLLETIARETDSKLKTSLDNTIVTYDVGTPPPPGKAKRKAAVTTTTPSAETD